MAKRGDLPYQTGERTGMQKIKTQRTADCVVGGFRYLEKKPLVGSLLLGLYNDKGKLDHVGFCSSIHDEDRARADQETRKNDQAPRIHRQSPRRTKPLEHKTFHGMAAPRQQTRRRSPIRSLHRRTLPPRHQIPPLASRKIPTLLHHEASPTRKPLRSGLTLTIREIVKENPNRAGGNSRVVVALPTVEGQAWRGAASSDSETLISAPSKMFKPSSNCSSVVTSGISSRTTFP